MFLSACLFLPNGLSFGHLNDRQMNTLNVLSVILGVRKTYRYISYTNIKCVCEHACKVTFQINEKSLPKS